jgi:hypothetical protein
MIIDRAKKFLTIKKLLLYSFLLETLCVSYALYWKAATPITSVLFTLSGVVIVFCFLKLPRPITDQVIAITPIWRKYRAVLSVMALMAIGGAAYKWIQDAPMDYHDGDMLPIIKIMNERFLNGQWSHVYDLIPEIWNGIQPIYLPAMWLPFGLPVLLGLDLRWMTFIALFMVSALFLFKINPKHHKAPYLVLAAFVLIWWLLSAENSGLIPYTEEGVVILFYSLLAIALTGKNVWFIGITTSLCILSRYAIVGWLPAMLLYYALNKDWKSLLQFCVTGLACFLLLVLIPFGWTTFLKLASIPGEYIAFSKRVWNDSPQVFKESLGWAKFFGPENIATQHALLVGLSLTLPSIFVVGIWFLNRGGVRKNGEEMEVGKEIQETNHNAKINLEHLPFAALKLTLVVFYTLVDVPYLYLFYTGSFVSLFLVTHILAGAHPTKGAYATV